MPTKKPPLIELDDASLAGATEITPADGGLSQRIADVESDGGNYQAFNDHGEHPTYALGKYQFVPSYHWKNIRKITGVKSWEEFLNKPQAQEDYYSWHVENNLKPSVEQLREYNKDGYSDDQLARLVHFKGAGGAKKWLTNHVDDTTENNISIDKYIGKPNSQQDSLQEIDPNDLSGAVEVPDQPQQQQSGEWDPNNPAVATIDTGGPVQGISVGVTGKPSQSAPAPRPQKQRTLDDVKQEIADATNYVAQDIMNNQQAPSAYGDNLRTIPFKEPGSLVHDITNPTGDPEMSAGYLKARLAQMNKDYKISLDRERASLQNDPSADVHAAGTATAQHFAEMQKMQGAIDHIIDLQLAYRAHTTNNYDPVLLGMEKQRLMGNKRAEQDEIDYKNKKQLSPHAKMGYQLVGLNILQSGKQATMANGQDAIASKFGEHSDDIEERLEKDNPEVFKQERIRQIANEIYKKENPLYGTLFSRPSVSQEEMEKAAKALGMSKRDIANISPDEIPRSAGWLNQAAQGFVNTLGAPLYEGGMRALAKTGIANQDAVNRRFRPGWEEDNSFGHAFTGQTPTAQHEISIHNPGGVVGVMAKGVGDLAGFLLSGEAGAGALTKLGIVNDAVKANKISNFATAALPAYNSAYQKSVEQFGDKPEDESKRQLYSVINGIVGGAVMMIDPKADIARDILGETKAGTDVIKLIQNKDLSELTRDELKNKITQVLTETTKHVGLQTAIPTIATAAGNITDMIMDPAHDHKLSDNLGQAAIGGAVGMFLPSLFSGLRAPANQTAMNKALMWEVGTNARKYRNEVTALYKSGDMPREQALQTIDNINNASNIIKAQLPMASITGKELTPGQQQEYAWSLLKSDDLSKQLPTVEATGDKAQIDEVKSMISAEEKLRAEILAKAGEAKNAEKPTLKITTDPSLSQQTTKSAKENSEKNNTNTEENVSLTPEDNTSSKTDSDGKVTENQEREHEVGSGIGETAGRGSKAEVREATGGEIPREGQDRLLNPEESKGEGGTDKEPPLPVSGKKKRKFVNEDEEAPADSKNEAPAVEVTPITAERQQAHTKGVFQDESGTLYKSIETKDGKTNEHEVLSELQDLNNVVRVGAKEKTSEGEAFPVEEVTPLKENDKISFKEAEDVMSTLEEMDNRGIYSGEIELGRDADGKVKIFDLSTAEKRDDTTTDQNYSTAEVNKGRISQHLSEQDAALMRKRNEAKIMSAERAMMAEATGYELNAHEPVSVSGKKLTPIPTDKATSHKAAIKQSRAWDEWLLENAKNVVKGNDYLETQVNAIKPTGKSKTLTTADREMLNDLLFGNPDGAKINYEVAAKEVKPVDAPKEKAATPKRKQKRKETEYQRRKREASSSDPMTFREAVLQLIVGGERVNYDDIKNDLGYKAEDMKSYIRRLAKDGTSVDNFIEQFLHTDEVGRGGMPQLVHDSIDARREFMDIWQDYAHDENKALSELERIQGKDYREWEGEPYEAHIVGEDMVAATQHDIDSFLENGDFEARRAADDVIQSAELTDSDSDNIISYLSSHIADGVLDGDKAFDTQSPEFAEMYKNLSSAGRKLIDTLVAEKESGGFIELSPEERESFNKLQTEANERSKGQEGQPVTDSGEKTSQQAAPGEGPSPRGSGEQVYENRGPQKPVPERTVKDIDLDLQIQKQSQKLEGQKRTAAEKAGDIPAANKANENWYKKQAKIEKLQAEKAELLKKQSAEEHEEALKSSFSRAADWIESTYARNKKSHEGIVTSNLLGLGHKLTEPIADYIVARVADGVRELGNLVVAIDRAIRMAKDKFGDEAKALSIRDDAKAIAANIGINAPPMDRAPVLSLANEEAAKDILADVRAGMPYDEAVREIMEDGDLGEKTKAKLLNYLDWHLRDQEIHNTQTLRAPDYGNKYIGDYSLTGSGETSTYLSGKTLADVHGKDVQFDLEAKETQLQRNIVQDTANMVGLAKKHTGSDDPLIFGADMLHQLNRIPDGGENSVKKVLAISGLNNELHGERIRLENELQNPSKSGDGFVMTNRNEITKRLRDLNRMIAQVEIKYRDITSNASDILNAARANRLFRNTYFHDLYADKILSEQQQREKQKTEEALIKTEVPDEVAEKGALQDAEFAEKSVEQVIQDKEKSDAGKDVAHDITGKTDKRKPPKPGNKEKSKGFINRLRERFSGKKDKEGDMDTRKEILSKDAAAKKAEEYLNGSSIDDLFQKAKEQTKKPC